MRIAHIIMANKNPAQIERLIKAMDHPDFYFFIHLDQKVNIADFKFLAQLNNVKFIENRILCNWGGYSFVKAIFASVREVMEDVRDFDFFNLMSGQDYPIKSPALIHQFYAANLGKCFISYDQDPMGRWWKHAINRAELYHFTDLTFRGKYFVQRLFNQLLPKRIFPVSLQLYGSSDSSWWTISKDCAAYLVDYMVDKPQLDNFMKYTWGSDEFLIATIIMNSPHCKNVINDNLRLITWYDGLANPRIFTIGDLDLLLQSKKLFARKFDHAVDHNVLDALDQSFINNFSATND